MLQAPVAVLRPPEAHAAEQNLGELLGGADLNLLAGEGVNVLFQLSERLGEFSREPCQYLGVDEHAARSIRQAR